MKRKSEPNPVWEASLNKPGENLVEREVKKLFRTHAIEDIRVQEVNTRRDIEEKKQELRKLVGTRYRDLIDSADSIIHMRQLSQELFNSMSQMEQNCHNLGKKRNEQLSGNGLNILPSTNTMNETEIRRKKYLLGKQIKILVDTPEQIWSALENHSYLQATNLYLTAENIHTALLGQTSDENSMKILASIPLLHRQWSTITQFPPKILGGSRIYLLKNKMPEENYAGALCSIILLAKITLKQAFSEFLNARLKAVLNIFSEESDKNLEDFEIVLDKLYNLATITQETLYHIKTIFYQENKDTPSLLYYLLKPIIDSPNIIPLQVDLSFISLDDIRTSCSEWLSTCANEITSRGILLLHRVTKAKQLKQIEEAVLNTINTPFGSFLDNLESTKTPEWKELSHLILNEEVELWNKLFRSIFMQRGKEIITDTFKQLSIASHLNQCLSNSSIPDHNIGRYIWENDTEQKIELTKKKASGLTTTLDNILNQFDMQLETCMSDLKFLLEKGPTSSDVLELHTFLKYSFSQSILTLSNELEKSLISIEKKLQENSRDNSESAGVSLFISTLEYPKLNSTAASLLDQALFMGRVCKALYTHSNQLKVLLNAPLQSNPTKNTRVTSFRIFKEVEESEDFLKVKELLRRQYLFSHALWVFWVVKEMGILFRKSVMEDDWNSNLKRLTWEELTITISIEDKKSVEEKIRLPFQPSSYVISFLFSLAKEIHRVGGHTLDKTILYYVLYELSEKIMSIYTSFQQNSGITKNKDGLIQLLVDIKFCFDVVSGRMEMESEKEQKELSQVISMIHKEEFAEVGVDQIIAWNKLIKCVENELDPIDIAFYQPHLKQCVQKCYKRCTLLLGSLVQFNKTHSNSRQKISLQEQHNMLVLAPLVTRFSLLPINTPSLKPQQGSIEDNKNTSPGPAPTWSVPSFPMESELTEKPSTPQSFVDKLGSFITGEKKQSDRGKSDNLWFL